MRENFRDVSQKRAVLFERIFVTVLLACFFVWISLIFLGKRDSRQYDLFFARTEDFLADGVALDTGAISVFAAANGRYAPGRTFCSPLSAIDDGKLDLCILRNLSPARLQKAIQMLASGSYADDPAFAGDFILRRDGSIEIESSKEMTLYADTMPVTDKHFIIKNIPKSVGLVVPGTPG